MSWIDWVFLGLNAITYALGHYHGNNRGTAKAADAIGAAVDTLTAAQAAAQQQQDAQAAAAGAAAGKAAYEAGKQPPKAS